MRFTASGVQVFPLLPPLAAFCISAVTSMAGVSGAVVLLPFQVSVLGFTSAAVTPTNHLFNVLAIPAGVYRYLREGRLLWPLVAVILLGSLPGVLAGTLARIYWLADSRHFQLFMGAVLLLVAAQLVRKLLAARAGGPLEHAAALRVRTLRFSARHLEYAFAGRTYRISSAALSLLCLLIGLIGGAYGVGGGALIAPLLVTLFGLPVHSIAGATLCGTWLTSSCSVLSFALARPVLGVLSVAPDWLLGLLFGAGGMLGMYVGARLQRWVPARLLEGLLTLLIGSLGLSYLIGFWR